MPDPISKLLHMAISGPFADCALPPDVLVEGRAQSAKKLVAAMQEMMRAGYKLEAPDSPKELGRGTATRGQPVAIIWWLSEAERRRGEVELKKRGFAVKPSATGRTSQVAITGGTRREDVDGGAAIAEDFSAAELDRWWAEARPKLIKGSRDTRHSRMNGCIRSLRDMRDARDGGVEGDGTSQTQLNPAPKKERDCEDQPVDRTPGKVDEDRHPADSVPPTTEFPMSLSKSIAAFRKLAEANISAPTVDRETAGTKQYSPKSKFAPAYYAGPGVGYTGTPAPVPADKEAMASATRSTAGVKGPGYDSSGREYVDVRTEWVDRRTADLLGTLYETADTLGEFEALVEKYIGFEKLSKKLEKRGDVKDPKAVAAAIGRKKYGKEKFQKAAAAGKKLKNEAREVVNVQVENLTMDELGQFLDEMVNVSTSVGDLAGLLEKYVGVEFLREHVIGARGDETALELARALGQAKYGETLEHLQHRKGMGLQNSFAGGDDWEGDMAFAEAMLNDTLDRKQPVRAESNIRAPGVDRETPDGKQLSPKSKFAREYYPGPGNQYTGTAAPIPADREAMAAATRSTAGVSGPGYGADGREEVDVRTEQRVPRGRGNVNGNSLSEILAGIEDQSYPGELVSR